MNEYKRKSESLKTELEEWKKRALDHENGLRAVDVWWDQLLDEVSLMTKSGSPAPIDYDNPFPTATRFKESNELSRHLEQKATMIKDKITEIMGNLASTQGEPSVEVQEMREKFAKLLAAQKEEMVKYDNIRVQLQDATEKYRASSLRAYRAEKKLERAKSASVQRIEQQAIAGTGNSAGSGFSGVENGFDSRKEVANGLPQDDEASRSQLKEISAVSEKQKEQMDQLMKNNASLAEQLTAATVKLSNLTDDDYAHTTLFKNFKTQHEEVIKRINHLEATNIQLREEAEKLQAERTAYRNQIQEETDALAGDVEIQMQQLQADLTRVRSARDELIADQAQRKAVQDQERCSIAQMKEVVAAKEDIINRLDAEVRKLKGAAEETLKEESLKPDIDSLDAEELRKKYVSLEKNFQSLNTELPALETAYRRAVNTASKKVMDFAGLEEKCQMLMAEKSKADQKYFAARKEMDNRIGEVRALRAQNAKSSEIISSLKDSEAREKSFLITMEKQVSDLKQANTTIMHEHKKLQSSSADFTSKIDALKAQVAELTILLKAKDGTVVGLKEQHYSTETEIEKLKVKLEKAQKERDSWKKKSLSNQSGEEQDLRVCHFVADSHSPANKPSETCFVCCLLIQLQEYCAKDMRPSLLQQMC